MLCIFLLAIVVYNLFSQDYEINKKDSTLLSFNYTQEYFFRNNEYFNNLYDGITFIGSNVCPYLSFRKNNSLNLKIGSYFRIFNGKERLYINNIFYQVKFNLFKGSELLMGNIEGHKMHNLIEPLYCYDNEYLENPETGLQLLFNYEKFKSDLWLNWQKFILPRDNFKEEFVAGVNSFIYLSKSLKYNYAAIFKHKGGQIEINDSPMQTFCNMNNGITLQIKITDYNLYFSSNYLQYFDLSPYKLLQYITGYGFYNFVELFTKKRLLLNIGYWYGQYYYSPIGEPLFQSLSRKYVYYEEPTKKLIIFKFNYLHNVTNNTPLNIYFQFYYDYERKYLDYSYGLYYKFDFTEKIFNRAF